eukprot:scaffold145799_cov50-Cyclotella_meneghiniana.AAC.1
MAMGGLQGSQGYKFWVAEGSYQHVHTESVSCGTITPKPLLLNRPIHSLWIYQMMLHGGDGDGWSARISRVQVLGVAEG